MKVLFRPSAFATAIVFAASCGTTSSTTTTDSVNANPSDLIEISVTVGVDSAADRVELIPLGASVRVTLTNPEGVDEFHLHGYDIGSGEVAAGQAAVFEFEATQPGSFEIESHSSEQVLVVLQIS